jgi:hypothetical protein
VHEKFYMSSLSKSVHNMVFFIPLLGLRVSQFNGEKFGATPDPTQKTITNFIRWTNKNQFGGR